MNTAAKITNYLMLGSAAVVTLDFIKKNDISLIINAASSAYTANAIKDSSTRILVIDAEDNTEYLIQRHFEDVAQEIYDEQKQGGKIFVHCIAGISRSASLVIAYMMRFENMSLKQAHEHVRKRRIFIRPNSGFWKQLVEYEKKLFGKNTITMIPHQTGMIPSVYEDDYKSMV